nr:AAA domain-containing protein [Myxococcus sp. AM011]
MEDSSRPAAADASRSESAREPVDVLLSKLANPEQEEIAMRLEQHGCVLVQGPPGTGKTHTIANLVGHLLAQGKSVLVTSHTTKALKVLRNQVVPELQPLCVSVLENDLDSRKQLEGAIFSIAERLSSSDGAKLGAEAVQFARHRRQLLAHLQCAREELREALTDEYRDVVVGGDAWPPSQAARLVSEEMEAHDWLPGPVMLGASLSLTEEDVRELYRTNTLVTNRHEAELSRALPPLDDILSPQDFEVLVQKRKTLGTEKLDVHAELWPGAPQAEEATDLEGLADRCMRAMAPLGGGEAWKLAVVAAGMAGDAESAPWKALLDLVQRVRAEALGSRELLLQHAPTTAAEGSVDDQLHVLAEIEQHLKGGGKLGALALLTHPSWKRIIRSSRVESGEPREPAHFQALAALLGLKKARNVLRGRWDRQMATLGAPAATDLGEAPEEVALQLCGEIERNLQWAGTVWAPLEQELDRCGLRWRGLVDAEPVNLASNGGLLRRRDAVVTQVVLALRTRAKGVALARVRARLRKAVAKLDAWGGPSAPSPIVRGLVESLTARNVEAYARDFALLADVHERMQWLVRRRELLAHLESVAAGWAAAIQDRRGVHGQAVPPGDALAAWRWRQLHDELERRGSVQLSVLQAKLEALSEELRRCTANLIERRAWAAQVQRTTLRQQQALVGWLDIVRRIGKGTGVRVPRLRAEAARLMGECRGAVPVWIMPLAQVVENFGASARFDVVIIDEASQCDAMALIALYMAKSAVVVGDHEQVSPSAVGQNLDIVQHLIDEHLDGIPNSILYDGKMSIYDLARASFGGMVCLTEHFRCVPDIIEFSNSLSYEGRIKPLREAASARVSPALLVHRVEGHAEAKVNQTEARAVASLVVAAVANPAYAGRTFGVISLVGEEQAIEVEQLLRNHLDPTEYERRRILCGNAAQFQGDERDVMFLSMVDSPRDGGPLALRATQEFKQRFNVAVSRARDQLWVVHSLNAAIDLKPDDLRRRLLEHCSNPPGVERSLQRAEVKTESPFEREVLARLLRAGFRVTPQWKVGHYRIDLVVEGGGRRLAVECDGDRYHPIEKLPEDMARQAILERLGWRFVRIRGSAFFRDADAAMKPVFARLAELEISPEAGKKADATEEARGDSLRASLVRSAEALVREWTAQTGRTDVEPEEGPASQRAPREAPRTPPQQRQRNVMAEVDAVELPPRGARRAAQQVGRVVQVEMPLSVSAVSARGNDIRGAPSRSEENSLTAAVTAELPRDSFKCLKCRGVRRLWVGEKGPFLKCDALSCARLSEYVALDVLVAALAQLRGPCSCRALVRVSRGPSGHAVLACSDTKTCKKSWPWRVYRDWLRERPLH